MSPYPEFWTRFIPEFWTRFIPEFWTRFIPEFWTRFIPDFHAGSIPVSSPHSARRRYRRDIHTPVLCRFTRRRLRALRRALTPMNANATLTTERTA